MARSTLLERDVEIEPGLRYTEETGRQLRSLPVRDCFLWKEGVDEPISGLNLVSFRQRFGALSVPSEGIGGVETLPEFRQQGYMGTLMNAAVEGIAGRVKVAFVSDAIEDVYEKYGFVTCLGEGHLSVQVRDVDRHVELSRRAGEETSSGRIRAFSENDLPAMVELYNEVHAHRPGTHKRTDEWNRLLETRTWRPGSEVIVVENGGDMAGYAILTEQRFGRVISPFVVDELAAGDVTAARALLIELASRCWQLRIGEFQVREPLDSVVGRAAREFGCNYHQAFPRSGGMMGAILDRHGLLQLLEPELRRRLSRDKFGVSQQTAFDALCQGEIAADNGALLRLLLGYWSVDDALAAGVTIPAPHKPICDLWFPGGGTRTMPQPYSHLLDRY